jgi:hypothetical protein
LEIDHIIPKARGGSDDETNLWSACRMCNSFKGTPMTARDPLSRRRVRLFNPRRQRWSRHFRWSEDGTYIIGRTSRGRATVIALQLNHIIAVMVNRSGWLLVGIHQAIESSVTSPTGHAAWRLRPIIDSSPEETIAVCLASFVYLAPSFKRLIRALSHWLMDRDAYMPMLGQVQCLKEFQHTIFVDRLNHTLHDRDLLLLYRHVPKPGGFLLK